MDLIAKVAQGVTEVQYSSILAQALAPAILLTAISAFLSMIMNRLWRVLDLARGLAPDPRQPLDAEAAASLTVLHQRARLIYRSIYACVCSAVAVMSVVLLTFANRVFGAVQDWGVGSLFVVAIVLFGVAFVYLLLEVRLAVAEFEKRDRKLLAGGTTAAK